MTFNYPPDHNERMRVLEQSTPSSGWREDDTMITMLQRKAIALLAMAQDVLAGKQPVLRPLVAEFIGLCSQLNVERHGDDKEAATRLLSTVDKVRDELRRLWANPHTSEIVAQIALLEPAFEALNSKLAQQWSECRSESLATECAALGQALRARRMQLAKRSSFAEFSQAV